MTNETQTDSEIAAAQAEADRYSAYLEQKDVCARLDARTDRAATQFFALGEGPGDLQYWQECIATGNRARANLQALGR